MCTGEVRQLEWQAAVSVVISIKSLEVVNKFWYLGDMISAGGGGVQESIVARIVGGRNLGNFCLCLRYYHCTQMVNLFQGMCQECCSLWYWDLKSERKGFGKAGEKLHDDGTEDV